MASAVTFVVLAGQPPKIPGQYNVAPTRDRRTAGTRLYDCMADIVIASTAAFGTTLLVHPVDVAKTRIQLQGELQRRGKYAVHYRNVPHAIYQVIRYDGIRAIYRGIFPASMYQVVSQGIRLGLFQYVQDFGFTMDENLEPSIKLSAISGAFCGAISAFVASPLFMAKSYLMIKSDSEIAVGHQRPYKTTFHAIRDIYTQYHLRNGLWRGTTSNVIRISVGSALQLSTFIGMKNILEFSVEEDQRFAFFNTLIAAVVSGLVASPVIASLDLIRARMYIQPVTSSGHGAYYHGFWDCARQIKKKEGFLGFFKGSAGAFIYCMLTSTITLVSWDELKGMRQQRMNSRQYILDLGYQ